MEEPFLKTDDEFDGSSTFKPVLCASVAGLGALMFGISLGFGSPALTPMQGYADFTYPPAGHFGSYGSYTTGFVNPSNGVFECDTFQTDPTDPSYGECTESQQASYWGSIVNIGAMVGALLGGTLVDKLGRKKAIMLAALPFGGSWVWTAITSSFTSLMVARFFIGVAVGIVSLAVPIYIGETAPPRLRGGLGAMNQLAITIGIFVIYLLGVVFKSSDDHPYLDGHGVVQTGRNECQWRLLSWFAAVASGALFVCMSFLPESPTWLFRTNRRGDAEKALHWIRGNACHTVDGELRTMEDSLLDEGDAEPAKMADLLHPDLRKQLVVGLGIMVCQQWSGINAVIFYAGEIFQDAGSTNKDSSAMIVMAVQVIITCVACVLMDKAGRVVLLLVASAGMCLFCITMGVFFYMKNVTGTLVSSISWIALVSLMGYIIMFSLGLGAIPWVLMGEIFPERVRGLASSVATCLNWSMSFVLTALFSKMKDGLTTHGTFWFFSAVCAVCFVFVKVNVPETKGKTLDEIQAHFKRH